MAKNKTENSVTLIAANAEVCGDVNFENQLYINGHVQGNIGAEDGLDDVGEKSVHGGRLTDGECP